MFVIIVVVLVICCIIYTALRIPPRSRWDQESNLTHKCEAKQNATVGFEMHVLSLGLKLNIMLVWDSECMLNHHVEAKQHAAYGGFRTAM